MLKDETEDDYKTKIKVLDSQRHILPKDHKRKIVFSKQDRLRFAKKRDNLWVYKPDTHEYLVLYGALRRVFPKEITKLILSFGYENIVDIDTAAVFVSGGRVYSKKHARELEFDPPMETDVAYDSLNQLKQKDPIFFRYFPDAVVKRNRIEPIPKSETNGNLFTIPLNVTPI
jgi:hypothetical protein